jgi:DNA repair exonuclease SbcCD ATPase subunit
MRKIVFFCVIAVVSMVMTGCGNKTDQLQKQVDSLQLALLQSNEDYNQLNLFVTIMSDGLDSIAAQENTLLVRSPESPTPSREQMKRGLRQLKETIKQQKDRIGQLEKSLAEGRGDVKKLKTVIDALKQQMEQKDAQITDLLTQLEKSNLSVEQLTERVGMLTQQTEEQRDLIAQQEEVMQTQDQALNEAFVKIATKKELKEAGLLSGGFLKKSKVDYSNVDRQIFKAIDVRHVTEISIPSKNPKLLTPVPAGSYTLKKDGDNTTLSITDPGKFWGVSNFLIIQTD